MGFKKGSIPTWFCFFERGKILAYFKEEPKDVSSIINIIFMCQILSVEENVDNSKSHFKINLKPNKKTEEPESIHIKCENDHDRNQWIKALKFFKDYYKDLDQSKEIEDELDIET